LTFGVWTDENIVICIYVPGKSLIFLLTCIELERIRGEKQIFKRFSSFSALSVISQNSAAAMFGKQLAS
jgi:hypothetical protein